MSRIIEEKIDPLRFSGAVDADGHILEAADLWEKYCEPKYRATAIRMKVDDQGLDYLEIGGKPSRVNRGGTFSGAGLMGQVTREKGAFNPRLHYRRRVPARRDGRQAAHPTPGPGGARRRDHLPDPRSHVGDRM